MIAHASSKNVRPNVSRASRPRIVREAAATVAYAGGTPATRVARINVRIHPRLPDSPAARRVAELFGLAPAGNLRDGALVLYDDLELTLAPGEVVAVVGPSGAGKSLLLAAIKSAWPEAVQLDLAALGRCDLPAVDALGDPASPICLRQGYGGRVRATPRQAPPARRDDLPARLALLSRCGLAEAGVLLTPARRLSGGQRYRLALARAVAQARPGGVVLADEFGSTLDGPTALVLAGQIRRLARQRRIGFVIATPRPELARALSPDCLITKPLGGPARVEECGARLRSASPRRAAKAAARNWRRWPIVPGTMADYHALAGFHYLAGRPAAVKRIWAIRTPPGLRKLGAPATAAVLLVSPPTIGCGARTIATGGRYQRAGGIARLNREVETLSRVIVHPTFRSCGLAVRLVRHALATAGTPLVEALAAMGAVHPFFELAGMLDFGPFPGRRHPYYYYLATRGA